MPLPVKLDHSVVHVSDWERSNAFYRDVVGAEVVPRAAFYAYRFGDTQLNLHGPGMTGSFAIGPPVTPGPWRFSWVSPNRYAVRTPCLTTSAPSTSR